MEFFKDDIFIYLLILFKYIYLFSSIYVFISDRTIYSVLALIISFVGGACLSIMVGATFVGFLLLVVYVGAVLVFFLFVTMMINTDFKDSSLSNRRMINLAFVASSIIFIFIEVWCSFYSLPSYPRDFFGFLVYYSNISLVGYIVYNYYWYSFIVCGLALLVAMVGAIALLVIKPNFYSDYSYDDNKQVQNISEQVNAQDFRSLRLSRQIIYLYKVVAHLHL